MINIINMDTQWILILILILIYNFKFLLGPCLMIKLSILSIELKL